MSETVKMELEDFTQYDDFVEKFKPKKTTDDCYTPKNVYDAVKDWAVKRYGLEGREIIRPFWPGGDYENEQYQEGCVVLDNPPFSMLAKICRFYLHRKIDFFLFGPGLNIFKDDPEIGYVICDLSIRYENGAEVPTSFCTNLGENKIETAPELSRQIREMQKGNKRGARYEYPDTVITAAKVRFYDGKGVNFAIPRTAKTEFIRAIDANKSKGIFGAGFLVSKKTAAAAAAVEIKARVFELSEREKRIVALLSEMEENE